MNLESNRYLSCPAPCDAATSTSANAARARPARVPRSSIAGQAYLLCSFTRFRRPVFAEPEPARVACRALSEPQLWRDSHLLAWVLMPDHWLGLVQLGRIDTLETLMGRAKAVSARRVAVASPAHSGLWCRGFQHHALAAGEGVREFARLLVATPVRSGLAAKLGDYPYWDAIWLGGRGGGSGDGLG